MSDATSGPAAATTAPSASRASRSWWKFGTDALQSIAPAQRKITTPSVVVRRTRSARTPNGSVAIAPTSAVTDDEQADVGVRDVQAQAELAR